ncbi:SCO family protein [Pseudoduganella sp. LjRoot289]|uniref:SCO family protein n=1 Tax=Pseudoduganella sp. LjRoot289 TaxID=3342314 RepID=UPI003ED0CFBC
MFNRRDAVLAASAGPALAALALLGALALPGGLAIAADGPASQPVAPAQAALRAPSPLASQSSALALASHSSAPAPSQSIVPAMASQLAAPASQPAAPATAPARAAAQALGAPLGLKGGVFEPPRLAPDFTLRGSDGKPLTLSRLRGKLVVLEFGYTSCPDVCPVSLATLTAARQKLGPLAAGVQVVYVTVDPERDTVAQMHDYLAHFDPSILGATGSEEQLARVRKDYGISASKKMIEGGKGAYTIGHSSYLYFIDRKGYLRSLLPFGRSADDVAHDAAILLKN